MDNDEILMRIKKHYFFLKSVEEKVDQKIIDECKKNMERLFFELLKYNLKTNL
jgi:hypothetical protein